MGNTASTVSVHRLDLGILLQNISPAWCSAQLMTNGYVRNVTISGTLGGLVCDETTVVPAWVLDGGGRLATFSHLRVTDGAGYVVSYPQSETNEIYSEFIDDIQPGSKASQTGGPVEVCGEEGMCTGSLFVGGTEYWVSFIGHLGALLCGDYSLAPVPLGGLSDYGLGFLTGLRNIDLSINSTLGIHHEHDNQKATFVVGQNRTMVWRGWLSGSNWRRYSLDADEAAPSWSYYCSSGCASCPTRCHGDCYGELTSELTLDAIQGQPPSRQLSENQEIARRSWIILGANTDEALVHIIPRPEIEALPTPERLTSDEQLTAVLGGPFEFDLTLDLNNLKHRVEPIKGICRSLLDPVTTKALAKGKAAGDTVTGVSRGAAGAEALLGIKNGRVLSNGAAARILSQGGAKEVSGVVFAGGSAGGAASGVTSAIITELSIKTACGLILGTTKVAYNPDSEAGRGIEAWRKTIAGEGLSTKEWSQLWQNYPSQFAIIRYIIGLANGEVTVGINHDHPLLKAIKYYVRTLVPRKLFRCRANTHGQVTEL
ncbi:hypothetical protein CDD81_5859 [Ophiocordyceps australis]|uniref:Uncharacterized protein n=1 Tax=Ophiocordyceps australis TaxID=1399860 RepID=A0A2C5YDD2_9HYPO|nr:hypothetical protein CDD81_5859 [Ophiocordyceps australis]